MSNLIELNIMNNSQKEPTKYICFVCGIQSLNDKEFISHTRQHRMQRPAYRINCIYCDRIFSKNKLYEFHLNESHRCQFCKFESGNSMDLACHKQQHEILKPQAGGRKRKVEISCYPFKEVSAFSGFLKTFRHVVRKQKPICSVQDYFNLYKKTVFSILENSLGNIKSIKFQISLHCEFLRENDVLNEIENEICQHFVNSDLKVALNKQYLQKIDKEITAQIQHIVDLFEKNGSGWQFNQVLGCDIRIAEFEMFKGGCKSISVPERYRGKRAIINPLNSGNNCFIYAFLIQMHYNDVPKYRRGSTQQYDQFKHLYNWESIKFPTTIRQIAKFEKLNANKMFALNVWGTDSDKELNIKHQSIYCRDKTRTMVNLLFVEEHSFDIGHFMTITQISRLLGKSSNHSRSLCYNCFSTFAPENIATHESLCFQFKHQRVVMPEASKAECYFKDVQKRLKTRYVIYADFESLCVPPKKKSGGQAIVLNEHSPSGYCLAISDSYAKKREIIKYSLYRGPNSMNKFLEELYQISGDLLNENETTKAPMQKLTKKELKRFQTSSTCHICERKMDNSEKVKDHCHITGKFRNAAHHSCNSKYLQPKKIPVVMHSFKTFDLQLLLSNISHFPEESVDVIPSNSEKFLSIITSKFYFVDSLMHLSASLSKLVENLNPLDSPRKEFQKTFSPLIKVFGKSKAKALSRKGVYPYEYMTSFQKFNETEFPDKKCFYNSLTSSEVDEEDYNYGKSIFKKYCKNMGDYHDLYILTDTLLLLCVMDKWRETARQSYGLEPILYFSLPGFAWDAALFKSKQRLELLTDPSIYNFLETGLRGGVSMISHRYAKANNKFMPDFDKKTQ